MKKENLIAIVITILFLGITISPILSAVDVDKNDIDNDKVKIYKFAKIKTTETTGGFAFCIPGFFRSIYLIRGILFHSFVIYDNNYWEGWYLTINGDKVSRGRGYIFGFTGRINNWLGGFGTKPDYNAFKLDGFSLLIIHISD